MLVYFPQFVLLVDTLLDCHLSCKPLGWAAPLDTLHCVQPHCSPSLYPSKQLLCHARSPRIWPSLRMTLLLMGLQRMFLLQLRRNLVLLWFLLADFVCPQCLSQLSHLLTRLHSTCLPCLLTFGCLQIRSTLLLVCQSLPTLPLHITQHRCSSPPSIATKSLNSSIILIPLFQLFVHVTLKTTQTL